MERIKNTIGDNSRSAGFYPSAPKVWEKSFRRFLNQKVLRSTDLKFAYAHYTGRGGLHGLNRREFESFRAYAKAKQSYEMGQFFTPDEICESIVDMLEIEDGKVVADICSGKGSFFNYLSNNRLFGVEKDKDAWLVSKRLFPKARIQNCGMENMMPLPPCDYIVGNPPFNLDIHEENHPLQWRDGIILSQSYYLERCYRYLKPGGFLAFVAPHFRKSTANRSTKRFFWQNFDLIAKVYLPEDTFQANNVKDLPTKIIVAQKKLDCFGRFAPIFNATYTGRMEFLESWQHSEAYSEFLRRKEIMNQRSC